MKSVREIITRIKEKYESFEYYELLVDEIERNVDMNPDITIESCKSLIEGISKIVINRLNSSYDRKKVDVLDLNDLVKKALEELVVYEEWIEEDFARRVVSVVHIIGEIRNKRGDISHGKLAPKEIESETRFSNFVLQITDAIVFYMLDVFFTVDLSYKDEVKYEDNSEFNNMLDELEPITGISYSKALYDQDRASYIEQLAVFDSNDESEEQ